jgi:hypothetical protein
MHCSIITTPFHQLPLNNFNEMVGGRRDERGGEMVCKCTSIEDSIVSFASAIRCVNSKNNGQTSSAVPRKAYADASGTCGGHFDRCTSVNSVGE